MTQNAPNRVKINNSKQSKSRDKLSLTLIVFMSFFLMADMYITPAIIPELSLEFGVSQEAIGVAGTAFMLLGAVMGLVFGYLNDRISRKKLLLIAVAIGEIPCLLTGIYGVTYNFEMFVLMRVLTGFGIGGIYPITFSLLSDYVTDKHRAKASACVDIAWGLGILSGPLLATFALDTEYGWRLAFILAALPSLPLMLLYWWLANEPERGQSELNEQERQNVLRHSVEQQKPVANQIATRWSNTYVGFQSVLANRSNLLLFVQGIPGSIPWGLLPFWIITFFREERDLTVSQATYIWEVFGIATVVGGLAWAVLGDWLFQKRAKYVAALCALMILVGIVPEYLLLNMTFVNPDAYLLLAVIAGLCISVASANTRALLMNVNAPENRGKAFSTYNFFDSIGKGVGPVIGSLILMTTNSYQIMVNVAISFWLVCAIIFACVIFTLDTDRQNMMQKLME